jgi:hypothetical protein
VRRRGGLGEPEIDEFLEHAYQAATGAVIEIPADVLRFAEEDR